MCWDPEQGCVLQVVCAGGFVAGKRRCPAQRCPTILAHLMGPRGRKRERERCAGWDPSDQQGRVAEI